MKVTAEEIDDEYYMDVLLRYEDIEALLKKEYVQGAGHLNGEQISVLLALQEDS